MTISFRRILATLGTSVAALSLSVGAPAHASSGSSQGSAALPAPGTGKIWSWGWDAYGQLGDGAPTSDSWLPVRNQRRGNFSDASVSFHALALREDGSLIGWGLNASHEVKPSSISGDLFLSPALIPAPTTFMDVAAGYGDSFALDHDGGLWAWGENQGGSLGIGDAVVHNRPTRVPGVPALDKLLQGGHSGITTDGRVFYWGGLGDEPPSAKTPAQLDAPGPVAHMSGGDLLLRDGSVWGWGTGESRVRVELPGPAVSIATGNGTHFAVLTTGEVYSWGYSQQFSLGRDLPDDFRFHAVPRQIQGLPEIRSVAAANDNGWALDRQGRLWAWGAGGELRGDGGVTARFTPSLISLPGKVLQVEADQSVVVIVAPA